MINKGDVKELYKKSDKRIIMFLENIVSVMNGVEDDYKVVFDMMEAQLCLYFLAKDDIKKNGINITSKPSGNIVKNPAVAIMQQAYIRLIDLMKECGVTKMSKAKLKRINGSDGGEDTEKLLSALLS